MKFFLINNSHCSDCNHCTVACPAGAIHTEDDRRYINYDMCNSCGNCLKECLSGAVTVEEIGSLIYKAEKSDSYLTRIRRLEKELSATRERLAMTEENTDKIIDSIPVAAVIAERGGKIITANRLLIEVCGIDPLALENMPGNLSGENISTIFPLDVKKAIDFSVSEGAGRNHVTAINRHPVSVGLYPLSGDFILCTVSDLADKNIAGEEILRVLREAIDRKVNMVQKIGALLGDEASAEINDLNTAINIIELSSEISGNDNDK